MKNQVLVLNADFSFLGTVSIKRAFLYISKGKVHVEKYADSVISTVESSFKIPIVVRFIKFIRQIYAKKVPWSKKNVLVRDNYTCQYCGKTGEQMTVDHVIPKSRGGKNSFDNTVSSCYTCNNSKGDRTPSEARMYLKTKPVQPTISEFLRKKRIDFNIEELLGF